MQLETLVITGDSRRADRGQVFGFVIALVALAVATAAFLAGHDAVAGVIGGSTVTGLAAIFVLGRLMQQRERAAKSETRRR